MLNSIKVFFYRLYLYYNSYFPIQRGKTFVGKQLYRLLGNADFTIDDFKLNMCILSLIDRYILETGVYDGRIAEHINRAFKNGGLYIDIGANFGYYTLLAARHQNVHVIAFEPSPREANRLLYNAKINSLSNITLHQVALSNTAATVTLNLHDVENPGQNSLLVSANGTQPIQVSCMRLDDIISKDTISAAKLIKIDVEGFEYEVLQGMEGIVDAFNGTFIIEMNYDMINQGATNPDKIYDWMAERNFVPQPGALKAGQYDELFNRRR